MYEAFFNMGSAPFSLLPDADFLYLGANHRRAANVLDYGLFAHAGFVLITGEVGAGKTTIVRRMMKNANRDLVIGLVTNPMPNLGCLMDWVLQAFEMDPAGRSPAACYHAFVDFLVKRYAAGQRCVLVIDEAQNLTPALLEELRMLSNVNNEKDQLLQIVLVGQPELLETMRRPDLRQLLQRVSVHCHLAPLSDQETKEYIRHRVALAGGSADLFDDATCDAVYRYTGGVPRLINLLCDQTLVYAFSDDTPAPTPCLVAEVVADRAKMGTNPFVDL